MRILVIDDEPPMLKVIQRLLSGEHEVLTAESASDAFFLLATFGGNLNVILCDVHLPGMDGPQFLSRLSPLDASRVVFMTGGARYAGDEAFLAGRDVLYKPFDARQLVAIIEAAANRTAA